MHPIRRRLAAAITFTVGLAASASPALAQAPHPWQMGMQVAHSPVQHQLNSLHNLVTWLMVAVVLFVGGLLAYVIYKFASHRNPKPTQTSHNTPLEIAWTLLPALILVVIAIPSFRLIYFEDRTQNADMTIKVIGHQWYWEYQYPDHDGIKFDSYMVQDADLKPGQIRNLDVDNQIVLPVGKNVRVLATSADVIHSWFIPSLGVQRYAIPGRTIETWVRVDDPGTYYGQCNQICGTNHSAMPIAVRALSEADFAKWVEEAKQKFASGAPDRQRQLAANDQAR